MFKNDNDTLIRIEALEKSAIDLKNYMIEQTAQRLCELGKELSDSNDFREAMHTDGPNGDHTLIMVEDEISQKMESWPSMIDVMRDSEEWENDIFHEDTRRAARALVNESYEKAEKLWDTWEPEVSGPTL